MTINVRRAREIAAEFGPGECGPFDDFAESTRPLRDDEVSPLYRAAVERADWSAQFGSLDATRQLLRLADYAEVEGRRRGLQL